MRVFTETFDTNIETYVLIYSLNVFVNEALVIWQGLERKSAPEVYCFPKHRHKRVVAMKPFCNYLSPILDYGFYFCSGATHFSYISFEVNPESFI